MQLNFISTDKAFRSYKNINGHPQAKALAKVQQEILRVADNIITANKLLKKYPFQEAGDRLYLLRNQSALYALLNVKKAIRG